MGYHDYGFTCGRFQMLTIKHVELIKMGFNHCDEFLVLIGSSNIAGNLVNPFTYQFRKYLMSQVFGAEIIIAGLPDIGPEVLKHEWGNHVLAHASFRLGSTPSYMCYGHDEDRQAWFNPKIIKNMEFETLTRSDDISATRLRKFIVQDNYIEWKKDVVQELWSDFGTIRDELLKVQEYKEMLLN